MRTPEQSSDPVLLRTFRHRMVKYLRSGAHPAPECLYTLAAEFGIPDDIVMREGQVLCQAGLLETVMRSHMDGTAVRGLPPPPASPDAKLSAILRELYRYNSDAEATKNQLAELRNANPELFAIWDDHK